MPGDVVSLELQTQWPRETEVFGTHTLPKDRGPGRQPRGEVQLEEEEEGRGETKGGPLRQSEWAGTGEKTRTHGSQGEDLVQMGSCLPAESS